MKPILISSEAAAKIKDGMSIMAAGFLSTGSAISVWQELAKSNAMLILNPPVKLPLQ